MIRVISQTTAERNQETRELFNEVKPLMDKEDLTLGQAVKRIKQIPNTNFYNQAWFKELKNYAKTQGYKPKR